MDDRARAAHEPARDAIAAMLFFIRKDNDALNEILSIERSPFEARQFVLQLLGHIESMIKNIDSVLQEPNATLRMIEDTAVRLAAVDAGG